ncbi:hypothetical protein DUI87_17229 [Hirundo rustica rustica]|uniref:Uncharacterized protein n=1 Tax=Hirundo rustica rustica TaxID=333673 RepID=A0A3M0KKL1_HIRRU|nr:hypothetical protein DUI87_17229 [Hirundo rustica rustica]
MRGGLRWKRCGLGRDRDTERGRDRDTERGRDRAGHRDTERGRDTELGPAPRPGSADEEAIPAEEEDEEVWEDGDNGHRRLGEAQLQSLYHILQSLPRHNKRKILFLYYT